MSNGTHHAERLLKESKERLHDHDLKMVATARRLARPLTEHELSELARVALPPTRDFSKFVTLVYDQVGGGCGGATTLGIANILKEMECPFTPDLSLRFLHYVFNDSVGAHRDPRVTRTGLDQSGVMVYYGCCSESTWPFVAYPADPDSPPDQAFEEALHYRLMLLDAESENPGCSDPIDNPDALTIKRLLVSRGPLVAYSDNHVFAVIGYDDNKGHFTILNSWGDGWGVNGMLGVPYDKIGNPLGADHTFDVKRVRYFRNQMGTVGPSLTGRIRVRHEQARRHLQITLWVEGQPPSVVWAPRDYDSSKSLCLDFPLPSYASQFWPPNEDHPWFVEVADRSPGASPATVAVVEEVTLVERIRTTDGHWLPNLYRPAAQAFKVPRGGSITIQVPSCPRFSNVTIAGSDLLVALSSAASHLLMKVRGAGGGGQNMFAVSEDDGVFTGVPGYDYWSGTQSFGSEVSDIIHVPGAVQAETLVATTNGRIVKVQGTGESGQNMFAATESENGFEALPGHTCLIGSQRLGPGAIRLYKAADVLFVAQGNRLLKIRGTGGGGYNMFALTNDENGNIVGVPDYDYWIGTQEFSSPVTDLLYEQGQTIVSLADGRIVKVKGTGEGGQNMFAVTDSENGFETVPGYTCVIGSQRLGPGAIRLYKAADVLFVAQGNRLLKIRGTGGGGYNMFALTNDENGNIVGVPDYDYWIGTQAI